MHLWFCMRCPNSLLWTSRCSAFLHICSCFSSLCLVLNLLYSTALSFLLCSAVLFSSYVACSVLTCSVSTLVCSFPLTVSFRLPVFVSIYKLTSYCTVAMRCYALLASHILVYVPLSWLPSVLCHFLLLQYLWEWQSPRPDLFFFSSTSPFRFVLFFHLLTIILPSPFRSRLIPLLIQSSIFCSRLLLMTWTCLSFLLVNWLLDISCAYFLLETQNFSIGFVLGFHADYSLYCSLCFSPYQCQTTELLHHRLLHSSLVDNLKSVR